MQHLLHQDTQLIFHDWGTPATLEEVSLYYDPETGQMEESESSTDITVLVSPQTAAPIGSTLATAHRQQVTFLIRSEEVADDVILAMAHIKHRNIRYRIQAISSATLPGIIAIECFNEEVCLDET